MQIEGRISEMRTEAFMRMLEQRDALTLLPGDVTDVVMLLAFWKGLSERPRSPLDGED